MNCVYLDSKDEIEIKVFTSLAKHRLLENEYTPGQRLEALLTEKELDRRAFQLFGYSSKLINRTLHDFFFDPIARFKTTCAQIIRWGAVELQNVTRINSYKVGEALGAKLKYSEDAAPSTADYILKNENDFAKLSVPDLAAYLAKDIWSIKNIINRFDDMIGPPTTFLYPPFSWVATYLLNVNQLLIYLYDNPSFVHELCEFATELEMMVSNRLTEEADCAFFMPDGFCELLSPDQYKEFAIPYMAKLINANKNSLFYITVPKPDYRLVNDLYQAVRNHKKLICMGSSINPANPLQNINDLHQFCTILNSFRRPFQIAINQNVVKQASEQELEIHIKEMIDVARSGNFMIRTDVIDPETPPQKIDALIGLVNKYGTA